jgi:cytidylate kinase
MAILTISREYGSGGREIGRAVAEQLGYAYEDRATLLAALRAADPRWERFGEEYDESTPTLWERFDWSFRGYAALLQRHLLAAAAAGRAVIVGRGGAFLLAGVPTALHVRIVAPLAARTECIARREQADRDSVRALVERVDRERAGFVRAVYGRAWDDPVAYDRIFDTCQLGHAAIVAEVLAQLALREGADRDAARRLLEVRLAAARVRAALFTERRLQLPTLEVRVEGAGVLVQGVLHRPEEQHLIRRAAVEQAGGHPLRFELHYR